MPCVLRHKESGEIAASLQKNHYDLAYYGVKHWPAEQEAAGEMAVYLEAEGFGAADLWEVLSLREERVKLMNVKLKNDPERLLYMDAEGGLTVVAHVVPKQTTKSERTE
ncbi:MULTISPECIES: hypothetical protein [Paenibacillus]|uniref:hypothetical protein n=1 Tax=Paenibacillus TaxID=44249 RepID=UPI0022B90D02|nr:hypothetical protein [Paenibacillus caseinilyticus]MCZ8521738.1 hypothetical protein [Paenibacillus caseinilyticus]